MQEFWFCSQCKSMNRGNSKQCYSCRAPKEQATLATVAERHEGVILTPGLDEEHREVAWSLMTRSTYMSAWKLGYLVSVVCFIRALAWCMFSVVFLPLFIATALNTDLILSPLQENLLNVSWYGFLVLSLVALVLQAVFLGLTATNTAALGSGSPRFGPIRSALWWPESVLWAIRGSLAFFVPAVLVLLAVGLFGIIAILAGIVWFVCAFWLLGDPISCLSKPSRLLRDLWQRLGVPGSDDSRIVTWWSMAWGTARGTFSAVCGIGFIFFVFLLIYAFVLYRGTGQHLTMADEGQFQAILTVMIILVYAVVFAAEAISLFVMSRLMYGLGHRQKVREEWVVGGFNRAQANAMAAAQANPPAQAAGGAPMPNQVLQPSQFQQPAAQAPQEQVFQPYPAAQLAPAPYPAAPQPPYQPAPQPPYQPAPQPAPAPYQPAPQPPQQPANIPMRPIVAAEPANPWSQPPAPAPAQPAPLAPPIPQQPTAPAPFARELLAPPEPPAQLERPAWLPVRPERPEPAQQEPAPPPPAPSERPAWPPAPQAWPPAPAQAPAPEPESGPTSPPRPAPAPNPWLAPAAPSTVIQPSSQGLSGLGKTPPSTPAPEPLADAGDAPESRTEDADWGEGL